MAQRFFQGVTRKQWVTTSPQAARPDVAEISRRGLIVAVGGSAAAPAAVLASYRIAPEDNIHAQRMLRTVFQGLAVIEASGGFQFDTDIDESFEWLIDFVHRGMPS